MSEEVKTPANPRDELRLKLPEPDVSVDQPWGDDVLGRVDIAGRLTNLIRNQSTPYVISIHGYWGTGKTFLLKRWQKDLENQQFRAIYFNAWEDDFCDDPLVAILGQLSEYFREGSLKSLANKVGEVAMPLIWQNIRGVAEKHTGMTFVLDQSKGNPLKSYLSQRATKDDLKRCLTEMSAKVRCETGHPMVFIIDELDRCRPTFAIELLERVKHIFDVPNLVFVFGINRDELCTSLESLYGNIDATVYLRRFFDMEFILPEVDSVTFGSHLMRKYELGKFFVALSRDANSKLHAEDFEVLDKYFPALWGHFGLSLRDIDHCVRSIALVGRNLELRHYMYPWLLGLLITLKLTNSTLYRQFKQGDCLGSEVMNYIYKAADLQRIDGSSAHALNVIEAFLYQLEAGFDGWAVNTPTALSQLQLLENGQELTHPQYLSKRTIEGGTQRAGRLIDIAQSWRSLDLEFRVVNYLAALIDLHQELVRR